MRIIEITSLNLRHRDDGHLVQESATELHAIKRLHERYAIPLREAVNTMMDHLALILAGEAEYRGRQDRGRDLYRIAGEGRTYWVVYDDQIKRIVTYLTPRASVSAMVDRAQKHRKTRRLRLVEDDE